MIMTLEPKNNVEVTSFQFPPARSVIGCFVPFQNVRSCFRTFGRVSVGKVAGERERKRYFPHHDATERSPPAESSSVECI